MADISDVLNLLVAQAATAVYPNGTGQASIVNVPVVIYPGWPQPKRLETDMVAGSAHVSVFALPTERSTSRHISRRWTITQQPVVTLAATVSGNTVTISGSVAGRQNVLILLNGQHYIYPAQATDTLISIATGLASLIKGATSSGPVVTLLPGWHQLLARVGGVGTAVQETKRQEKQFQITVWARTPAVRDQLGAAIDSTLSVSTNLSMPDGSAGILRYSHCMQIDDLQKATLYRRDLIYTVDYATTTIQAVTQVIAPELVVHDQNSGNTIVTVKE